MDDSFGFGPAPSGARILWQGIALILFCLVGCLLVDQLGWLLLALAAAVIGGVGWSFIRPLRAARQPPALPPLTLANLTAHLLQALDATPDDAAAHARGGIPAAQWQRIQARVGAARQPRVQVCEGPITLAHRQSRQLAWDELAIDQVVFRDHSGARLFHAFYRGATYRVYFIDVIPSRWTRAEARVILSAEALALAAPPPGRSA